MKKVIISVVASLLVSLLGIIGLNIFKESSPRERVKAENGSRIIVEELSFYTTVTRYSVRYSSPLTRKASSRTRWGQGRLSYSSTNR